MGKKRIRNIEEIARLAGVSKSTVSRALNNNSLIAEATRRRIQEIARTYEFRPSAAAQHLTQRTSRTVAFVTHSYHEDFSMADLFGLEILGGITSGLGERGYDLLVVHVDPKNSEWAAQYLDSGRVDGFILMTSVRKKKHVDLLLSMDAPFVAWGHGNGRYCSVVGDDYRGGRLAAEHLLGGGRRRVAFIGGPRVETEVQERYRGYVDALNEAGLDPDPRLCAYGDFSDRSGETAIREILGRVRANELDSLFVNSDLMAISAMRTLTSLGLHVPDDVAVVGYDNLSVAHYATPPLTTINQQVPLAGRYLARDLISYIENRIITETVMPVELVRRSSA